MIQSDATSDKHSTVDHVVTQIRDLIRDQSLEIGDVLPSEVDLAARFGAGRNTVREAVRTLKAYGVLESRRKVGAVITDQRQAAIANLMSITMEISADSFRDIQGFRRLTEMNLFTMLDGNLNAELFDTLDSANARMAAATDPVEASEHDFAFHLGLIKAAGNQTLSEVYTMLKPAVCKLMESGKSNRGALDAAVGEHAAIIGALRDGSRIDFLYHMNRHLDAGLEFIPKPHRA